MNKYNILKKIISVCICICMLIGFSTVLSYAAYDNTHSTGLLWDSTETIAEHMVDPPDASIQATLPTSVDNTSKFPTPGNQGTSASCAAWAVGYALT